MAFVVITPQINRLLKHLDAIRDSLPIRLPHRPAFCRKDQRLFDPKFELRALFHARLVGLRHSTTAIE
jgi:hypothetical protein